MVGGSSTEKKKTSVDSAPAMADATSTSGSRRSGRGSSLFAALFHSTRNKTSNATAEEPLPLPPPTKTKTAASKRAQDSNGTNGNLSDADSYEADLNSWIAARAAWWAGSDEGSSDSELELLECQRPAEMVSCSDDTSCSSVELIWSRPKQILLEPAALEQAPKPELQQLQQRAQKADDNVVGHGFEVLTISRPKHASSKPKQTRKALNGRLGNMNAPNGLPSPPAPATVIPAPTAAAPMRTATPLSVSRSTSASPAQSAANNNGSSTHLFESDTVVRGGVYKPGAIQRLSILELAKPSRAKDKQIGGSHRTGASNAKKGNPVLWVANPLFSDTQDETSASSDATGSKEQVSSASNQPTTPTEKTTNTAKAKDNSDKDEQEELSSANEITTSETETSTATKSPGKTKRTDQQQASNIEKPLSVAATTGEAKSTNSTDQKPAGNSASAAFALQLVAPTPAELRMRWLACHTDNYKDFSTSTTTTTSGAYSSLELEQQEQREQPNRRRASLSLITKPCSAQEFYGNLLPFANSNNSDASKRAKGKTNNKKRSTSNNDNYSLLASDDERVTDHSEPGNSLKKRWSFRARSPLIKSTTTGDNSSVSGSIYLSHIRQLDRRIKSNVSSIKSQISEKISDTSKRASVLADQLISSIKETTKEQFAFNSSSHNRRRSSNNNNNSYSGSDLECFDSKSVDFDNSSMLDSIVAPEPAAAHRQDAKRARLFSLIYEHQLHQANGQPVITKQPAPAGVTKMLGLRDDVIARNELATARLASTKDEDDYDFAEDCKILPETTTTTMGATNGDGSLSPNVPNALAVTNVGSSSNNSINRLAPARPPKPSEAALERMMRRKRRLHHTNNHRQQLAKREAFLVERDEKKRLASAKTAASPLEPAKADEITSKTQFAPIALASSSLSLGSSSSLDSTSSSSSAGIPSALRRTQSDRTHNEATGESSGNELNLTVDCDHASRVGGARRSASGPAASETFKTSANSNSNSGRQRTKKMTKRRERKAFNVAQRRACGDRDDSESDVDI